MYRRTHSALQWSNFKSLRNGYHHLILGTKKYFSKLVSSSSDNPRRLWQTVNKLLNHKSGSPLPSLDAATSIADRFAHFFTDISKISKLPLSLANNSSSTSPHSCTFTTGNSWFLCFKPASESEVYKILFNSPISSLILILFPPGSWKNVLLSLSPQSPILLTYLWALVISTQFSNNLLFSFS